MPLLRFLQVFSFTNMFLLTKEHVKRIKDLLLRLMVDPHIEVREAAASTFSGLIYCSFLDVNDDLIVILKIF